MQACVIADREPACDRDGGRRYLLAQTTDPSPCPPSSRSSAPAPALRPAALGRCLLSRASTGTVPSSTSPPDADSGERHVASSRRRRPARRGRDPTATDARTTLDTTRADVCADGDHSTAGTHRLGLEDRADTPSARRRLDMAERQRAPSCGPLRHELYKAPLSPPPSSSEHVSRPSARPSTVTRRRPVLRARLGQLALVLRAVDGGGRDDGGVTRPRRSGSSGCRRRHRGRPRALHRERTGKVQKLVRGSGRTDGCGGPHQRRYVLAMTSRTSRRRGWAPRSCGSTSR